MNNERDFVDLDKAVREHQMKKASTDGAKKKPAARGRFMDMVRPGAQTKPQVRTQTASRPVNTPAKKPETRPVSKPVKRRMDMVMPVKKAPVQKPAETYKSPEVPKPQRQPKPEAPKPERKEEKKPERPNLFSDDNDFAKESTPNANNYSIGGRSPFIRDAKVDKRPLGPNVPETNAGAIRSTKNVYSQRTPLKASADEMSGRNVITVAAPKKKSGWLWALLTLGIIVAGGGIGLLAYAIFASN